MLFIFPPIKMVASEGLEPSRGVTPADFESAASTDFATLARAWGYHEPDANIKRHPHSR